MEGIRSAVIIIFVGLLSAGCNAGSSGGGSRAATASSSSAGTSTSAIRSGNAGGGNDTVGNNSGTHLGPGAHDGLTVGAANGPSGLRSAELIDADLDGQASQGDQVALLFAQPIELTGGDASIVEVRNGTFGQGAVLGASDGHLHVVLGAQPQLTLGAGGTTIGLAGTIASGVLVNASTGQDVAGGDPVSLENRPSLVDAEVEDLDRDGAASPGDVLVLILDQPVVVDPSLAPKALVRFPVSGDALGAGAVLLPGTGAPNTIRIALAAGVNLGLSGFYDAAQMGAGNSSGIDMASDLQPGAVQDPYTGDDVRLSGAVDIELLSNGGSGPAGTPGAGGMTPTPIPTTTPGQRGTVQIQASPNPVAAGGFVTFTVRQTGFQPAPSTAQVKFLRTVYPVALVGGQGSVTVPVPTSQNGRRTAQATVSGVENWVSVQVNGSSSGGSGKFAKQGTLTLRALDGKTVYSPGETVNVEVRIQGWQPNPDSVKIRLVEWTAGYTRRLNILRGPGVPQNANYWMHIKLNKRTGTDVVRGSFKAPSKPGSYLTVAKRLLVFSEQFRFQVR